MLYFIFLFTHLQTGVLHHCAASFTLSHSATIHTEREKACIVSSYHYFITLTPKTAQPLADVAPAKKRHVLQLIYIFILAPNANIVT